MSAAWLAPAGSAAPAAVGAAAVGAAPAAATSTVPTGTATATSTSATSTSCTSAPTPSVPAGGVIRTRDFEDGTTQGWSGSGGVTVANTAEAAASGARSLRVDGLRTTNAAVSTLTNLPHIAWYRVTAKVKVPVGGRTTAVQLRPVSAGGTVYAGTASATAGGWTEISAQFQPAADTDPSWCPGHAPAAAVQLQLTLAPWSCASPSTVLVDDVQVIFTGFGPPTTTPTPTTATATACPTPPPTTTGPTTTLPPTTPVPSPVCSVAYRVAGQWTGGYQATVDVTNLGAAALPAWSLTWTQPAGQRISFLWGGTFTQNGSAVTVSSPSWAALPAHGTATVGFVATAPGAPGTPTAFALDGHACTTA